MVQQNVLQISNQCCLKTVRTTYLFVRNNNHVNQCNMYSLLESNDCNQNGSLVNEENSFTYIEEN